jgi:hypothetical protein
MALSDFFAGAGAAVIGGVVTAGGAWGAALLVERRRENLELVGAIKLLHREVKENRDRLEKGSKTGGLTLGMWEHCKPTLAPASSTRFIGDTLWDDLHDVYRKIYEVRNKLVDPEVDPVDVDELTKILDQLGKASEALLRASGLLRHWVGLGANRR